MSYDKGKDARFVIRLRCSSLKSLDPNPLTIYETGFVTATQNLADFHGSGVTNPSSTIAIRLDSWYKDVEN